MTQEHTADLKQRIEAQFSDLHQFLYQEEKLLQVKLKTEERRELIRLDEHKALLCVEISRLQGALHEVEEQLREQDPFALLRVGTIPAVSIGDESVVFSYFVSYRLKGAFDKHTPAVN